ncbi:hypothetical protein [Desulfobulbus elongatus]|uniref:hypothetical protein n=1 Tax=Desulfobulbus elongatus TaxID=53332 RepID=UPI000489416E|nr:hypothetical protein [Desulfobulbus elongatus]
MKIVTFQYNRAKAAIALNDGLATAHPAQARSEVTNTFLAGGYADRLLWEEAAALKPATPQEYCIVGNWQ